MSKIKLILLLLIFSRIIVIFSFIDTNIVQNEKHFRNLNSSRKIIDSDYKQKLVQKKHLKKLKNLRENIKYRHGMLRKIEYNHSEVEIKLIGNK